MKEILKKMLASMAKSAQLMKEGKQEEAVAELETVASEITDEQIDAIEEPTVTPAPIETPEPTAEEIEKSVNTEKLIKSLGGLDETALQSLAKWASVCVDAPELGDLIAQLMEVKDVLTATDITKLFADVKAISETVVKKADDVIQKQGSGLGAALCPTS